MRSVVPLLWNVEATVVFRTNLVFSLKISTGPLRYRLPAISSICCRNHALGGGCIGECVLCGWLGGWVLV